MSVDQNFPSYISELWLKKQPENKVNIIFITPSNVKCANILDTARVLPNMMCKSLPHRRDVEMWKICAS